MLYVSGFPILTKIEVNSTVCLKWSLSIMGAIKKKLTESTVPNTLIQFYLPAVKFHYLTIWEILTQLIITTVYYSVRFIFAKVAKVYCRSITLRSVTLQNPGKSRSAVTKVFSVPEEMQWGWPKDKGITIYSPNIQHQVQKYLSMLHPGDDSLKFSGGWFKNFEDHHGIKQVTIQGEQGPADEVAIKEYPQELMKMLEDVGFVPEQV